MQAVGPSMGSQKGETHLAWIGIHGIPVDARLQPVWRISRHLGPLAASSQRGAEAGLYYDLQGEGSQWRSLANARARGKTDE